MSSRSYLDWVPRDQRLRAALARGTRSFNNGDFVAAYRAFGYAALVAENDDLGFVRGLRHAAAAGVKRRRGDERGAERQVRHAERRLAAYRPVYRDVDVDAVLAAARE